jgi:CRP-like cAMP-binding protein
VRVIKILIAYGQIKLSLPEVIQVNWPEEWVKFLEYFGFLKFSILKYIGVTCLTKINYMHRFAALCALPLVVCLAAFVQHKINLARAEYVRTHFKNDHISVVRPRRAAAESLFESVQEGNERITKDDMLTTKEMRNLINQMKPRKSKKVGVLEEIKKRTSVAAGAAEEHQSTKAEKHANAQRELKEAENLIKLLGGQADDETGSFELTKNQFVEAFENGQLTYHACLPFDFVDRVVHSQMKQKALILGSTLLMFVHLPISLRIFQYFWCRKIGDRRFLHADYSIECYGPEWLAFSPLVYFVMIFFTVAYPLVMACILIIHRHELQSARIRQKYGFLYDRFSRGAEFWEVVDVMRKLILTCAVMWLPESLGPSVALSVSIVACCLLNYFRPHRNQVVFWVESASYLFAALSYVTSTILMQLHNEEEERSRFLIGMFLIGLDVALIFAAIAGSVFTIRQVQIRTQDIDNQNRLDRQRSLQSVVPVGAAGEPDGTESSSSVLKDAKSWGQPDKKGEGTPPAMNQRFLDARVLLHRTRALQRCEIFSTLTSANSRAVLDRMQYEQFSRGDAICNQGDPAIHFYIIVEGVVDVSIDHFFGVEGKEGSSVEVVNTLTRLDFFGESALLSDGLDSKRNATITCTSEKVQVFWLTRELVKELMESGDLTDRALEIALETGKRRRESNFQARRRSMLLDNAAGDSGEAKVTDSDDLFLPRALTTGADAKPT